MSNAISRRLDTLRDKGANNSVDVANLLDARPETVSRWNQGKAFPRPDTQRQLLNLEYIVDQLSDFYEPKEARLWLFSRQKLLGGRTPAEMIQQGKADDVIALVDQIRDGVFTWEITKVLRDPALLDRLREFPTAPFDGEVYRATRTNPHPLAASTAGGRWAPRGGVAVPGMRRPACSVRAMELRQPRPVP
jgi:hypothetical protein